MENYVILDAMCPGSFGTTLLVSDRSSGLELTLKKIECLDDGRANETLQEALPLLEVRHPNIVRVREMFISWDKEISSVILNVVMDCPDTDTLSTAISSQRDEKRPFGKQLKDVTSPLRAVVSLGLSIQFNSNAIQTFLGQMTDALTYLHKQHIIHRNLKPSNILVKGLTFRVCDFGTATFSSDTMKLQVKTKEGDRCWMSPESVSRKQWTDKSDIWSFGCVLLDMLTCHIHSHLASLSQLLSLKQTMGPLDIITCKELHTVLRKMFQHNPEYRANVWDLMKDVLVQRCLVLCGGPPHVMKTMPSGVTGPPFHEGLNKVLDFMLAYKDVESTQLQILSYLTSEKKTVTGRQDEVVRATCFTMMAHKDSAAVQLRACQMLQVCVEAGEESGAQKQCVYDDSVISCVLSAVDVHDGQPELLTEAFRLLFILSENARSARSFLELNGVGQAVRALKAFSHHQPIICHTCRCIWRALETHEPPAGVHLWGCVEAVCVAAETHPQEGVVMGAVCAALLSLSVRETFEDKDVEDATLVLLQALRGHSRLPTLVQHAFLALVNLTHMSKAACLRVLVAPGGGSGIVVMREARRQYPSDPQMSHCMVRVLAAMTEHAEVLEELISVGAQEDLKQIEADSAADEDLKMLIQLTLSRLREMEKASLS
ncbi:serine/threonine kinase-like domain-containing protein STKLD1 isoform X2 [Alosa alosa]|uniref:serine/threonine kinase-like domain-containing protein STKLD1 isoform X2 n=1 Tax=Alosa alosa TaxID=278164 RepID=UPI0020152D63|nr:serine/threonine kinase-like domain-containing protein STKLD1 isoform X2 [Alosa alosa]